MRHFYCLHFFFSFILSLSISCKSSTEKKETASFYVKENISQQINFDSILKCGYYTFRGTFFITADYGCIYNPKESNTFGNLIIYLIPKQKEVGNFEKYEKHVNNLDVKSLKNNFYIYIYIIPHEYLTVTAEGYYQKEKHLYNIYMLNEIDGNWELIRSKHVNSLREEQTEFNIIMRFIADKAMPQER